ncbi:hypothetical protein L227DRAFT_368208 [Lentinus tigrinus ALCF2SS1-6]|uniref:Uncharacterized protein n=1 Tax=Lentinus tigrinus ALCF2SS1-6 TaxID=1328759 RepID=A0A5C2SJS9_9APHY|nr:hypothetical protein L227DRAFT_368208 [Lentinus tigrinus ALCF2SS1-6]
MADTPLVRGVFAESWAAAALRDMARVVKEAALTGAVVVVVVVRKEGRERRREEAGNRRAGIGKRREYLCERWGSMAVWPPEYDPQGREREAAWGRFVDSELIVSHWTTDWAGGSGTLGCLARCAEHSGQGANRARMAYLCRLFSTERDVQVQDRVENMEEGDNQGITQVQMEPRQTAAPCPPAD